MSNNDPEKPEGEPADPFGAEPGANLFAAAVATHEMFSAFVRAGFTEEQALRIVMSQLATASNQLPPQIPGM